MPYFSFTEPRRESLLGYHGTSQASATAIVRSGFTPSNGDGEWLGHGVYFWDRPDAAWFWAEKRHQRPAVVQATLFLGYCLDLDAPTTFVEFLQEVWEELVAICEQEQRPIPVNAGDQRRRDCAVINLAAGRTIPPIDSIIRTCAAGEPVYPGGDLLSDTRRQICIRNPACMLYPQQEYRRS